MTTISRVPAPPLDSYIDDLYYLDSPSFPSLKVFPMPSLHLMVNLGGAFRVQGARDRRDETCAESWWMGLWSTYHIVQYPADVEVYGIHFKPGGASPFLQLPLSELHDQVVPLDALWGRCASEIRERLHAAPSIQAGLALFERLLLARLCDAHYGLNVVQYAIGEIAQHHGTLAIRTLSDQLGISHKHLDTQFKRMVGVSPKELARFYRFTHVLRTIDPAHPVDWTRLAHQCGFYDQSHFNKDFAAFTGSSPTDYLRQRQQHLHTHEYAPDFGYLPIG
jgi:AraC-like DNA-binding protein